MISACLKSSFFMGIPFLLFILASLTIVSNHTTGEKYSFLAHFIFAKNSVASSSSSKRARIADESRNTHISPFNSSKN